MRPYLLLFLIIIFFSSCKTNSRLFSEKSARDVYENRLKESGILETLMGKTWLQSSAKALTQPLDITIPYRQAGYFAADKPRAIGLKFSAKRGERLTFNLSKKSSSAFTIYLDLWKVVAGKPLSKEYILDTAKTSFYIDIDDNSTFVLRLQPELLHSGEYDLSISAGPSLAFPVPKGKVQSFWGAARDGGARKHEGIDIFAPKRTPIVAIANGRITRVEETDIGGKVVWLRPDGRDLSLYYAHLDEQLVEPGQKVNTGDTIGLVGNTGNARTTSPHLHFGIYGNGGATDPFPFVNPEIKKASSDYAVKDFNKIMRVVKTSRQKEDNNVILVTDATSTFAVGENPDGEIITVSSSLLQSTEKALVTHTTKKEVRLLDRPDILAAAVGVAKAGEKLKGIGYHGNFVLAEAGDLKGWIPKADFK